MARSWLPRTEGSVRLGFTRRGESCAIDVLYQAGAARARFPRSDVGGGIEAVLVNTAGGLTGGDRIDVGIALAAGSEATVTSAAAEKIYRAREEQPATMLIDLALEAGAFARWLPQPTILFDGARLERRTEVRLAGDARLLAVEMLIFGRAAMGEEVTLGELFDAWRVRREGVLLFAETLRLKGAIAETLRGKATLAGARAAALLLYAAPDAADRLCEARARLEGAGGIAGTSAFDGLLVVRGAARDGATLQRDFCPLIEWLGAQPLPRVWRC